MTNLRLPSRCFAFAPHQLTDSFNDIMNRLSRFPKCIEELVELREFMAGVPDTVRVLTHDIKKMFAIYDLTDSFLHK